MAISGVLQMRCVQESAQKHLSPNTPHEPEIQASHERMVASFRAATPSQKLRPEEQTQLDQMVARLRAAMPRMPNESEEDWNRRVRNLADASLRPVRERAERMRERDAQLEMIRAQREAEQRRQAELQRQREEEERRRAAAEAAAHAQYLRDHPEEAEREQREAEQRRVQEERMSQWYVLWRGGECEPLRTAVPGATIPQEALNYYTTAGRPAYLSDEASPFPTLHLAEGRMQLAAGFRNCVARRSSGWAR